MQYMNNLGSGYIDEICSKLNAEMDDIDPLRQ